MVSDRSNGGHRRYVIAAGVGIAVALIAATIIGLRLQPKDPQIRLDSGYEEIDRAYQTGGSGCDPAQLKALGSRHAKRETERCQEAKEQHREAANGLIETRRQADAANASAILAQEQTGIAGWGTGFGFVTMIAAILAALFAERAAHHTKRSANIAEDGNRAIIGVERGTFILRGTNLSVEITFKNGGSHHAINVFVEIRCQYEIWPVGSLIVKVAPKKFSAGVVIPGANFHAVDGADLSRDEVAAIHAREGCALVCGEVSYRLAKGGPTYHTYFAYCTGDTDLMLSSEGYRGTMSVAAEGNDAT